MSRGDPPTNPDAGGMLSRAVNGRSERSDKTRSR